MFLFLLYFLDVAPSANEPLPMIGIILLLAVILFLSVVFVAALVFVLIRFKRRRILQPSNPNQS